MSLLRWALLGACLQPPPPPPTQLRVPGAGGVPASADGLRGRLSGHCAHGAVVALAPVGRADDARSARVDALGRFIVPWHEDAAAPLQLWWGCDEDGDEWVRPPAEPLGKLSLGAARAWPELSLSLPSRAPHGALPRP